MANLTTRYSTVNFSRSKGGLSTVGYTMKNTDSTFSTYQARSTTGVTEIGTSTGIYGVTFSVDADWNGLILWDTGEVTPYYALDERFGQLNTIQEQTDRIRMIWNTLLQLSNGTNGLILRIEALEKIISESENEEDDESNLRVLSEIQTTLKEHTFHNKDLLENALILRNELNNIVTRLDVPRETVIDYTEKLDSIIKKIESIKPDERIEDLRDSLKSIISGLGYNNEQISKTNKMSSLFNDLSNKIEEGTSYILNSLTSSKSLIENKIDKSIPDLKPLESRWAQSNSEIGNIKSEIRKYSDILNYKIEQVKKDISEYEKFIPVLKEMYDMDNTLFKHHVNMQNNEIMKNSIPKIIALEASRRK